MKTVAFHNLGCKVNTYELDAMAELFENKGYKTVDFNEKADVYVINTCSVTNIADRKSRQMLSKARKTNQNALIIAVGCYVETREEELLKNERINICIGNNKKSKIVEIVEEYFETKPNIDSNPEKENCYEETIIVKDLDANSLYDDMKISKSEEHTRAFIKIQDGCNQFCSYCIIPYARGRVRSRKQDDIIEEIKRLVGAGYKEFVITGIHLSSYGSDFIYEKQKADQFAPDLLLGLLSQIDEIAGVERIRLGSLEPRIITEEFAVKLKKIKKLCAHFHLSLQSGSQSVLERMNRHYSAEEYYEKVKILKNVFKHPAITTDVIVGFPGETICEFEESKAFAEKCGFYEMHIFKYSVRKGTVAAGMKEQLTEKEKTDRSHILEEMEKKMSGAFREWYIGKKQKVLFEEEKNIDGKRYMVGFTEEYVKVACEDTGIISNSIETVKIVGRLNEMFMIGAKE